MAKETKRLVVLDTHAILHRAYHALPEFSSSKGEPTGALYGLMTMLMKLANDLKPNYVVAAVDLPEPTYRHTIYKEYKGTRAKTDDALVAQIIRMHDVLTAFGIPIYSAPGFEADDVIGTIVEKLKKDKSVDVVIATGDMDALQLVTDKKVQVYTLRKGLNDTVLYDEERVIERYGFGPALLPDYKGIRGDPSDNIPGVRGIGEKGATELIQKFGTLDAIYKALKKPDTLKEAGIKQGVIDKLSEQKDTAYLSRELGEINRKAPIQFALPKVEWRAGIHATEAVDFVNELEFRSLVPRVKALIEGKSSSATSTRRSPSVDDSVGVHSEQESLSLDSAPVQSSFFTAAETTDEAAVALAVWLLDPTSTEPTLEDIYRVGKSEDFETAKKNILADIKAKELTYVYEEIELPLMPVLRQMESTGVKIDKTFFAKISKEYTEELEKIAKRIYKHAGSEFNIGSPKQLGEVLFDKLGLEAKKKTAGGARSTRESELEKLKDAHPIIVDILAFREISKLLSTYIDAIPQLADEHDRLHTHYVQIGAATGRLASKDPNLQNIPIKSELGRAIRHGFVASEGFELVALDYSQVELRVAAFVTGDKGLIEIFKNNRDAHTEVASRVFGVKPEDVTYDQRRIAKVINFGILYGMGVTSLQQSLGTSRKEAQEFYNSYFKAFPKLEEYMDETKGQAARAGYTTTYFGRRRYFEGIKSSIPFVRAAAERMAINAPLQGTSADLIKLAMVRIAAWIKKEKLEGEVRMLLQVHDELVFEVKKDKLKALAPKIKEIMEGVLPPKDAKGIPFVAEGEHGPNWGEMEKLK